MDIKSSQITLTKQNDSLQVGISVNATIVLPEKLSLVIIFAVIKDFVFRLGREIILGIIFALDEMIYEELKVNLKKNGVKFRLAAYAIQ